MKSKSTKSKKSKQLVREEIFQSTLASFKMEGIRIPKDQALAALKKIEINLEKQT